MTSRELVLRTLDRSRPERIPRQLWLLPWAEIHHPQAVAALRRDYPDDIETAPAVYTDPPRVIGDRYARGTHVDEWGCRFENPHDGAIGIVQVPLIAGWDMLDEFHPPETTLSVDYILPYGGQAFDGAVRETDPERMQQRIDHDPRPNSSFDSYLKLFAAKPLHRAGFGVGLAQLLQHLMGLEHIEDAVIHPLVVSGLMAGGGEA